LIPEINQTHLLSGKQQY